jgi:hypothetical protein
LSRAITSLQRKQKYYESLLSLVEETLGDPTVNVQPNIITKTGTLVDDLRKMRTLLAKITDHLNTANIKLAPDPQEADESEETDLGPFEGIFGGLRGTLLEQVIRESTLGGS